MPLLEELSLGGCLRLSSAALVTASLPYDAIGADRGLVAGPRAAPHHDLAAAAGRGPAWGAGEGERAQDAGLDDAAAGEGGAAQQQLSFPVRGVALPQVTQIGYPP